MDWSAVFEYGEPWPGATQQQLADFVTQLSQPLTEHDIADVLSCHSNPYPSGHRLHASWQPLAPRRWRMPERPPPPSYLALLAWSDGGNFGNDERELQLFSTHEVREMALCYHVPEYMPGALPFAFNGGGVFYLFDLREPADAEGEYPVVATEAGNIGWSTYEECYPPQCWPVADSLEQTCCGRTNIESMSVGRP